MRNPSFASVAKKLNKAGGYRKNLVKAKVIASLHEIASVKKAKLNDILGLSDKNCFRSTVFTGPFEEDFRAYRLKFYIGNVLLSELISPSVSILNNTVKYLRGQMSIGEALHFAVGSMGTADTFRARRMENSFNKLFDYLGIVTNDPHYGIDQVIEKINELRARIFEEFRREVIISTNPVDFLTSGLVGKISHGYKPGWGFFATTSALAMDGQTVYVYTTLNGEALGRFWVHFDIDGDVFKVVLTTTFGFPESLVDITIDHICARITAYHGEPITWNKGKLRHVKLSGRVDIDNQWLELLKYSTHLDMVVSDNSEDFVFNYIIEPGMCLSCGAEGPWHHGFCRKCSI